MRFSFLLKRIGYRLISLSKKINRRNYNNTIIRWFSENGDKTHRLNYSLNQDSIVFDLGGYEGQWACDIYCKYRPKIFVFEPSLGFYQNIKARFNPNDDVKIYPLGLAASNVQVTLNLQKDGSSLFKKTSRGATELIELKEANSFLRELNIQTIDLMKINIEGGEYDLLEHLISTGWVKKIKNIQVQFHDFVENAETRMEGIQKNLALTHELTYQYRFVWENWKLKEGTL